MPLSTPKFSAPPFDALLTLRAVQAILSLLILILSATVISFFNTHLGIGAPPTSFIFLTFVSVFTLLISLPYNTFTARYFSAYTNRYTSLAVEVFTNVFWFGGWIGTAVYLGQINICRGSICGAAKAAAVLGALQWVLFCVTSWLPIYYTFFDDDVAGMGKSAGILKLSGAERINMARMRRDAANNERVRAEREGEKTGVMAWLERVGETSKVRVANVLGEWKEKSGRGGGDEQDRRSEMSEVVRREQRQNQSGSGFWGMGRRREDNSVV